MEKEKEHVQDILGWLSRNFHDYLILAGIVNEKAKLIDYKKGTGHMQLSSGRQNDININVSLIFSLAKQFEDFTGSLAHSVMTYDDHDVIIMDVSAGTILYVICAAGAASDIIDGLIRLNEDVPVREESNKWVVTGYNADFVSSDWTGR
jgi:hypothetical protein